MKQNQIKGIQIKNFSKIFDISMNDKKALLTKLKKLEIPNNEVCAKVFNNQGTIFLKNFSI